MWLSAHIHSNLHLDYEGPQKYCQAEFLETGGRSNRSIIIQSILARILIRPLSKALNVQNKTMIKSISTWSVVSYYTCLKWNRWFQIETFVKWQQQQYKNGFNSALEALQWQKSSFLLHFTGWIFKSKWPCRQGTNEKTKFQNCKRFLHVPEKTKTKVMWNKILHAGPWGHRTEHLLLCQVRINMTTASDQLNKEVNISILEHRRDSQIETSVVTTEFLASGACILYFTSSQASQNYWKPIVQFDQQIYSLVFSDQISNLVSATGWVKQKPIDV